MLFNLASGSSRHVPRTSEGADGGGELQPDIAGEPVLVAERTEVLGEELVAAEERREGRLALAEVHLQERDMSRHGGGGWNLGQSHVWERVANRYWGPNA